MKYFNESAEYFGDKLKPLVSDNRLSIRSVKIFADGIFTILLFPCLLFSLLIGALRTGGAAVSHIPKGTFSFTRIADISFYSFMNLMMTIHQPTVSCVSNRRCCTM